MMKILILNGPNLNLLGTREPELYGASTLDDVHALCVKTAHALGLEADCFQSNHEGELIDKIHAYGKLHKEGSVLGAVFNPALHDAIKGCGLPVIEVHISNVHARESFRHHSFVSPVARGSIIGLGIRGYELAIRGLVSVSP